jgi:hypothetical protein
MRLRTLGLLLGLVSLCAACATPPAASTAGSAGGTGTVAPPPAPTPTPGRASDNPEDVRARMPLRPTPYQHETKFPPPQQSPEEEEKKSNSAIEPDLLHGEPAVLLNGDPFPPRRPYDPKFPEAKRMRYVSADATGSGDGGANTDEPAGRVLPPRAGTGSSSPRASTPARSGSGRAAGGRRRPSRSSRAFLKAAPGGETSSPRRAHWQLWEVQLALPTRTSRAWLTRARRPTTSRSTRAHLRGGPAVVIKAGSDRVTLSNAHPPVQGVGSNPAPRVTLRNDHIHHNRAASVTIGGETRRLRRRHVVLGKPHPQRPRPGLDLGRCEKCRCREPPPNYRRTPRRSDRGGDPRGRRLPRRRLQRQHGARRRSP